MPESFLDLPPGEVGDELSPPIHVERWIFKTECHHAVVEAAARRGRGVGRVDQGSVDVEDVLIAAGRMPNYSARARSANQSARLTTDVPSVLRLHVLRAGRNLGA